MNRIRQHALGAILGDDKLRQSEQRELARLVGARAGHGGVRADTADVDDRLVAACQEQRQERPGDEVGTAQVDFPRVPPLVGMAGGDGLEGFEVAGVVDEDVEAGVEVLADLAGDGFDVGGVEDVEFVGVDFGGGVAGFGGLGGG